METGPDTECSALVDKHAKALELYSRFMVELEFLDDPDPERRFFRFGTDPTCMVLPTNYKPRPVQ